MHPNPVFRQAPTERNLAFARAKAFGMLTVNGPDGPLIAHAPFLLSDLGDYAELHLARSNPIARAGLPLAAVIAVQGPDAYVSPDWYGPAADVPDQVPTWNYVAVHLRGTLHPLPPEGLRAHVDDLSAEHENRLLPKTPWTSAKMSDGSMPRMIRMILPFRLEITAVEGTWKLNQNKAPELRLRVADVLENAPGSVPAHDIAALIRADKAV